MSGEKNDTHNTTVNCSQWYVIYFLTVKKRKKSWITTFPRDPQRIAYINQCPLCQVILAYGRMLVHQSVWKFFLSFFRIWNHSCITKSCFIKQCTTFTLPCFRILKMFSQTFQGTWELASSIRQSTQILRLKRCSLRTVL